MLFNQIIKIASFDIIDTDHLINKILELNTTTPFNSNFQSMGFGSMYFMNNMGTMFLAFVFYLIGILTLFSLDKCTLRSETIGKWVVRYRHKLFYNVFVSMMLESYSMISVCSLIHLHRIKFNSYGEIIQSVVLIIFFSSLFIFPAILIIVVKQQWNQK